MTPGIIFSGERGVLVEQSRVFDGFRLIGIGLPPSRYRSNLAAYFEAIRTWVPWEFGANPGQLSLNRIGRCCGWVRSGLRLILSIENASHLVAVLEVQDQLRLAGCDS